MYPPSAPVPSQLAGRFQGIELTAELAGEAVLCSGVEDSHPEQKQIIVIKTMNAP